ncbi:formate dehydrogenase accessory sulfurtransferase FdhD [Sphingomonas sp. RP10(2022)]|uniref:Sulfur carrier protein FdhD n=1 Tax=Sphingomonas liriopis TaxID=2949094 RepID=A0A9X2HU75_9SPHN|nr:formate dehydrogenase accessory sulfurtransferase FdhD [Sphingomonas liriopis]MCP3734466.1 formate dehydrogenase accessory sulfurtransferase FdhD [Sphingomonas liriopis]
MTPSRPEPTRILYPDGRTAPGTRAVAVEAPVAIEVDGLGYAVMMMTPMDLEAFAIGFMLTERLADTPEDVEDIDVFHAPAGWIVRVALSDRCRPRIHDRVRHRTSDTSCGLCGIASLEQLARPIAAHPPRPTVTAAAIFAALAALRDHQHLNAATGAVHAAAACTAEGAILAVFEDVGRHNALDKLIGQQARGTPAAFTLVTSRISFEMVDKALVAETPLLVGISAPTSLAIDHARVHGLTLVALARADAMLALNDPYGVFG